MARPHTPSKHFAALQGNSVLGRDEDSYAVFNGAVSANQLVVQETAWFGAANKGAYTLAYPSPIFLIYQCSILVAAQHKRQ